MCVFIYGLWFPWIKCIAVMCEKFSVSLFIHTFFFFSARFVTKSAMKCYCIIHIIYNNNNNNINFFSVSFSIACFTIWQIEMLCASFQSYMYINIFIYIQCAIYNTISNFDKKRLNQTPSYTNNSLDCFHFIVLFQNFI